MPKHRAISTASLVLALAALLPASAAAKAGGTDRPVTGTSLGEITTNVATLGITADASGVMSHLGKYTSHFDGTVRIVGGRTLGEGTFATVGANGDELSGTFTLNGDLPTTEVHTATVFLTITGGTGRFADASGTITIPLVVTPTCFLEPACPGHVVETQEGQLTGVISY